MRTDELLSALIARWASPYHIRQAAKLQYVLTAPLLSDGATGVKVTFAGDESPPLAELGVHEAPDLTIVIRGADFELLAADVLDSLRAGMTGRIQFIKHTPEADALVRRLGKSYLRRP
jgi:hypothetical protein